LKLAPSVRSLYTSTQKRTALKVIKMLTTSDTDFQPAYGYSSCYGIPFGIRQYYYAYARRNFRTIVQRHVASRPSIKMEQLVARRRQKRSVFGLFVSKVPPAVRPRHVSELAAINTHFSKSPRDNRHLLCRIR
jgi:hypothetical protein